MKKIITILWIFCLALGAKAASLTNLTWAQVCSGSMGTDWYGSTESQNVADTVLAVQKTNGGWMKNDQLHKLTSAEYTNLINARSSHSCLDNYATTQEMRFLAKVYQGCKVEKYRTAFLNALNMILTAEKSNGGWSQYWPLSGNGSYQDYITFNDDLMTNVMKILLDIYNNTGDFADLTDEATREKCIAAFNRGLDVIIACQIDDNGTPAAWCAQHDPSDFLPTEGRPHELPSVSGCESANLLSFLMSLDNPSQKLQDCITSAVLWLDSHKYMDNAAIEDYTNASGVADRHIVTKQGSAIWGRFIQIGGESGKKIYTKFYNKLKTRGKTRSHHSTGYTYYEYQILEASYDTAKAYQPIYAIYTDDYPELFYRHLYNYEDTPDSLDKYGQLVATSLTPGNRRSYQYLGSWCYNLIHVTYPAWKERIATQNEKGDCEIGTLSSDQNTGNNSSEEWTFNEGFSITNAKSKGYAKGNEGTVKFSAGVPFTIKIPEGIQVYKISFYGYDNYSDADAYISQVNGVSYGSSEYVFPAKTSDGTATFVKHLFDLSAAPVTGSLPFTVAGKQCCLIINLYYKTATGIQQTTMKVAADKAAKVMCNGEFCIQRGNTTFSVSGFKKK